MSLSFDEAVASFEQASVDAQHAHTLTSARRQLDQLCASRDCVQISLAVIRRNTSAQAVFFAASAIRAAVEQSWNSLPLSLRSGSNALHAQLVAAAYADRTRPQFALVALLRAAATSVNRAFLRTPPPDRIALFPSLADVEYSAANPHRFLVATHRIVTLVDVFLRPVSPFAYSPTDICVLLETRRAFTNATADSPLVLLFFVAVHSLNSLVTTLSATASVSTPPVLQLAVPPVSALLQLLSTDLLQPLYHNVATNDEGQPDDDDPLELVVNKSFQCVEFLPLINRLPHLVSLCLTLIQATVCASSSAVPPTLAPQLTQVLIAISSISPPSFGSLENALATLVPLVSGVHQHNWALSSDPHLPYAYAHLWRRLSLSHGLYTINALPLNHIESFANAAAHLLQRRRSSQPLTDETTELILNACFNLLPQPLLSNSQHVSSALSPHIPRVLTYFLDANLCLESPVVPLEPPVFTDPISPNPPPLFSPLSDSIITLAALLARRHLSAVVQPIKLSFVSLSQHIEQGSPQLPTIPNALDRLCFLVRFVVAVAADCVEGDYPSVPHEVLSNIRCNSTNPPHAVTLISVVLHAAKLHIKLRSDNINAFTTQPSLALSVALLQALFHIFRTYIFPSNPKTQQELTSGLDGQTFINEALAICVDYITCALHSIPEQLVVHHAAYLFSYLASVSANSQLNALPQWHQLLRSITQTSLQSAPLPISYIFAACLTQVYPDQAFQEIVQPSLKIIFTLLQQQNNPLLDLNHTLDSISHALQLMRGVLSNPSSLSERSHLTILQDLFTGPNPLAVATLQRWAQLGNHITPLVLELVHLVVRTRLAVCDDVSTTALRAFVKTFVHIVETYAQSLSIAGPLNDVDPDHVAENLRLIISVLMDLLDVDVQGFDVTEPCFAATLIVLQLRRAHCTPLHVDASAQCERLVSTLLFAHTEKLWMLPMPSVEAMLRCLHPLQPDGKNNSSGPYLRFTSHTLDAISQLARVSQLQDSSNSPVASGIEMAFEMMRNSLLVALTCYHGYVEDVERAAEALLNLMRTPGSSGRVICERLHCILLEKCGTADEASTAFIRRLVTALWSVAESSGDSPARQSKIFFEIIEKFSVDRCSVLTRSIEFAT